MLAFQLWLLTLETKDSERGATLVEYALLVTFIAIVCITAVAVLGDSISTPISSIQGPLNATR